MRLSITISLLLLAFFHISFAQSTKIILTDDAPLDSMNIIGRYMRAFRSFSLEGTELKLNVDKTFSLEDGGDLMTYSCHGKWHIEKDKYATWLCLTSDEQTYGITDVIEEVDGSDSLKFIVKDDNGSPVTYTPILVESGRILLDTIGRVAAKIHGIRAFIIRDSEFGDCDYRYELKNPNANKFLVKIKPKNKYYLYMKDLYWRIGVNFLYCHKNGMLLMKAK
jgi:hypothetical protein